MKDLEEFIKEETNENQPDIEEPNDLTTHLNMMKPIQNPLQDFKLNTPEDVSLRENLYERLYEIKNYYIKLRHDIRDKRLEIINIQDVMNTVLEQMNKDLAIKKNDLIADKELRAEYGFKSDKLWEPHVNNVLLAKEMGFINRFKNEKLDEIQKLNDIVTTLRIFKKECEMVMEIELAFL